jgi:PAS domain S-box-containing protein
VAIFFLLLSSPLSLGSRQIVSDVGLLIGSTTACVSCALRSRSWSGRRRRAWLFFALAMGSGSLANLWVLALDAGSGLPRWDGLSGALLLLALVLGIAGLSTFPSEARRGTDLARMVVDGVVIGGAIITMANETVFTQVVTTSGGWAQQVPVLLPLLLDVVTVTLAVLLIVRIGRTDRYSLAVLSAGVTLYAICDLWRSVLTARGSFNFGTPLDVGWIAGSVLIALAARSPAAAQIPREHEARDTSAAGGTVLIFALLLTAATLSIGSGPSVRGLSSTGLWLLLVLAVATRQILLIIDNDRLRHELERRVTERTTELRAATKQSELLLTSVGEGIYGVDQLGRVTFINPAGAHALGYRPEDLIGRGAHATFHARQSNGTPFPIESCYVTEAIQRGTVTNAEEDLYVRANGRELPVEVTATPMATDDEPEGTQHPVVRPGTPGAVVVFRDVTQRQEVDRLKSEFVSMVSHELRTPLTSIRGSLGLLAGGALGTLPPTAHRMIDLALDSSARLTRLINDILDIERIESGTMPMEVGNHQAGVLVEAAVAQLQVLAAQADVQLVVTEGEGLVHADPDRVVQTLLNLLDNAIKFSPRHSLVEVAAHELDDVVLFRIRDHGRGIPPDKLDQVFSRFLQVDSSDARDKGGSGLGLAISRSVVERLHGRIWAESDEGTGSTFFFTLPRAAPGAEVTPLDAHQLTSPDVQQVRRIYDSARATAGST